MTNKGYEIEDRMRRFFKGKNSYDDAVDFETSTTLYEVKSCNLFNPCVNGNDKRPFKKTPHKKIDTLQHGRFKIVNENHMRIRELAHEKGKKAKYIFVITVNKQVIWRIVHWFEIVPNKEKVYTFVTIKKIFGGIK